MSARIRSAVCARLVGLGVVLSTLALLVAPAPAPLYAQSAPKIAPALLTLMSSNTTQRLPVIVTLRPAAPPFSAGVNTGLAQQALKILQTYGEGIGALPIIDGAAGWATPAAIQAMSQLPQVAEIDEDSTVRPAHPTTAGPTWPAGRVDSMYALEVGANRVWQQGGTGRNVTVAVMDSGVAADPDLTTSHGNRLLASVNFADPEPAFSDRGGHGTHIAGTIAGDGTRSHGEYVGVAPGANIVDVRVLDQNGNGRYSSVLAGLSWVLAHESDYHIRVVNMSFGAPPVGSYLTDPLAAGVEIAWRAGLVVVVAAGNGGPSSGTVNSPGIDPYVITVGSTDDQTTSTLTDDTLGWWSSWGNNDSGTNKPDAVAPGRRVVSLRVPGSALDQLLPDHVVTASNGSTYFRLTGTSMSTAVVSGAVALLLEHQPDLTPDAVKQVLLSSTQPFGQSAPAPQAGSIGAGLIDAFRTRNAAPNGQANRGWQPANDVAMTLYPMLYGQAPLAWRNPSYLGLNWSGLTWGGVDWTNIAWDNYAWDNIAWDNIAWDNIAWDNIAWDNIAWDQTGSSNIAWDNIAWDNVNWD